MRKRFALNIVFWVVKKTISVFLLKSLGLKSNSVATPWLVPDAQLLCTCFNHKDDRTRKWPAVKKGQVFPLFIWLVVLFLHQNWTTEILEMGLNHFSWLQGLNIPCSFPSAEPLRADSFSHHVENAAGAFRSTPNRLNRASRGDTRGSGGWSTLRDGCLWWYTKCWPKSEVTKLYRFTVLHM